MGNGASCGENARDVGADEELNPMLMGDADKENHYRRPSVPHVQAERLKRKSALIRASMRQDDKKAMAQHVAVLRAGPKAGAEPPRAGTTKSTYHAPPTQEGWLAWATPNGSTRRYYRLVGSYLVRYADEEAARGASRGAAHGLEPDLVIARESMRLASMASTRTRRLDAVDASRESGGAVMPRRRDAAFMTNHAGAATFAAYAHGTEALISGNVDRDFVADLENRGSSFYVYTPTRTLTLYAPDLEAQRAWVAALRAAGEQVYDAEELKAKATALQEMAPLLLDQAQRQFKRMHQILASLKCTGYVVQDERVKSLKKGYLEFQRAEYEDEQFYGKLLEDSSTSEPRFAKAYCVLRSDQTLVYGSSEKEAKANPEGVVSLNHLHVVLDADAIEKSGDMVFSLVTPLRTFVVRAAHQVALEEWLKAIIRSTAKLNDKGNTLQALNELQEMDATEGVDLASLIDDDSGLDAFERFVSTLEDKKTKDVFACWRLCREHKDASEFDPLEFADTSVLVKQLEKRLVEDFLEEGGRLPSEIAVDARKECIAAMYPHGEKALPVNEVRAACVAELHALAYDQFKTTQDYKEYCLSKKDLGEPVEEGERVLIYAPKDPAALKERLAKMPKCSTKLKALDAIKNGSGKRVYEAWTSLKHSSEKTERVMIGRDHKCDVAVDDDKRVSREHARIDSLKDGRVVFLDLGSSHGSKVNGKTVSGRVFLNAGDVVHVGKTDMVFTVIPSGTANPLR